MWAVTLERVDDRRIETEDAQCQVTLLRLDESQMCRGNR